jgi:hypothetical protein
MTLDDLLSALEAATEGSRELDTMIERAIDRKMWDRWIPFYTRSIDAAMTLIPPNTFWHVGAGKTRDDEPMYGAMIQEAKFDGKELGIGETNASPALALVIAALRARKAQP